MSVSPGLYYGVYSYAEAGRILGVSPRRVARWVDGYFFMDRAIRGGEAVVSERAIPTRVIYNLWAKERDLERVAEYFDLPHEAVSAAIRYEGEWRLSA